MTQRSVWRITVTNSGWWFQDPEWHFLFIFWFILLRYSWLTTLCSFLLYSKVIQLYIHIRSFSDSLPLWFITGYWLWFSVLYSRALSIHSFFFKFFIFYIVVDFVIHWNETAMGLHVFPIPIPPPTSLSTRSLYVFPVHQVRALVVYPFYIQWFASADANSHSISPTPSSPLATTRLFSLRITLSYESM